MLLVGIAWLIESYDIGVIGNILPSLVKQFHLGALSQGLLVAASTLGIVVAVIPSGLFADRIGRKRILVFGTAWYAVFSFLGGFAPNPAMIILLRFVSGLGMGAVFPIPYAMAAELIPSHFRGAMTGVLDSFLSIGYFLAPLAAFMLVPHLPVNLGWRYLFFIGGIPVFYVPILLKWMPESPRWLQVRGRTDEANEVVSYLEYKVENRTKTFLPEPTMSPETYTQTLATRQKPSFLSILRGKYLKRTCMMWLAFSCILFVFYAVQTYTPTVLVKQGYSFSNAFLLTSIIVLASIPGKYAAAYALEKFGRKATLISFTAIASAGAVLFGLAHNPVLALICGIVLSFFGIGVDPAIKIYGAEQYPTAIRETGVGMFEGCGRFFGGALAPFIMAFIIANSGVFGSYLFVAIVALGGLVAVALLGTETRGKSIERAASITGALETH
jgi:putative MFS transporter